MAESGYDRFERLAEAFYRETGLIAPGKDVAAAYGMADDDYDRRCSAWARWLDSRATEIAPSASPVALDPWSLRHNLPPMTDAERIARTLMWLHHGCQQLYGDDGEMQCGCLVDWRRGDLLALEQHFMATNLRRASQDPAVVALLEGIKQPSKE